MLASRQMLDLTSQNVANMNTEGYTRQTGVLASRVGNGNALSAGNGVELTKLVRISDEFLENSLVESSSASAHDGQYSAMLEQLETIVGSDSVSITDGIDGLFKAFSQAAGSPESETAREQVLNQAAMVAGRFNQITQNLDLQERQVNEQTDALIQSANAKAQSVAALNEKILTQRSKGGSTGQLEDQRNVAIQDLAKSLDLNIQRLDNGTVSLTGKKGEPIVRGFEAATLSLTGSGVQTTMNGLSFELGNPGGKIGAYQSYKSGMLSDVRASINSQAEKLADDINAQLNSGFDLDMNAGKDLFQYNPSAPGSTIEVSNINARELAFIKDDGAGSPAGGIGSNDNLLQVIEMRPNFYNAFSNLIGDIGIKSGQAQLDRNSSEAFLADAKQRRDSVSAVNQDEEAINLMKFNQSYQANAKVIGTASDVFDTLMRMF